MSQSGHPCPKEKLKAPGSKQEDGLSRAEFLTLGILSAGALIGAVLGGSALAAFLSPAWKQKQEDWIAVADADSLPEGTPTLVNYDQRRADGWIIEEGRSSVWLLKEKGAITAFDPHCTHLGCPYRWDPTGQQFLCPCHSGVYNKAGVVVSGPPPRPLDRYGVRVQQGIVSILPLRQSA
jgi:menaquinol-cytochrome c reductase iron-sulfur subunit